MSPAWRERVTRAALETIGRAGIDGGPLGGRARWLVLAAAALVTGLGALDMVQHYGTGVGGGLALGGLRGAAVLGLLWRPIAGWWVVLATSVLTAMATTPDSAGEPWPWAVTSAFALAAGQLALTSRVHRDTAIALWVVVQAAGAGLILARSVPEASTWTSVAGAAVLTGLALVAGDAVSTGRRAQDRLRVAERIGDAERERRVLLEERARIARDLHDVVAHHMSVIAVQASSAQFRLGGLGPPVIKELHEIAASSRAALEEMRRVLDVLRSEPAPHGQLAPAPQAGISGLASLVQSVRRVGLRVDLRIDPDLMVNRVSPQIELVAYRVAQEALSNAVRHAEGAAVSVNVERDAFELLIDVSNGPGSPAPGTVGSGSGNGLAGMAERIATVAGELTAGPEPHGGFRVRAVIPLSKEDR